MIYISQIGSCLGPLPSAWAGGTEATVFVRVWGELYYFYSRDELIVNITFLLHNTVFPDFYVIFYSRYCCQVRSQNKKLPCTDTGKFSIEGRPVVAGLMPKGPSGSVPGPNRALRG